MTVEEIRNIVVPILRSYGASRAGLFGSAAHGEARSDSDVDILVHITKNLSLLGFVELKQKLEERLGRAVDLVEYEMIKPSLKEKILRSEVALL